MGWRGLILGLRGLSFGPERTDYGPERGRGGGRTDVRTDVWKFTPVSYRTSALWGRCPKRKRRKGEEKEDVHADADYGMRKTRV